MVDRFGRLRAEVGREVPELRGLFGDLVAAEGAFAPHQCLEALDNVVDVALGVDAAGDGEAQKLLVRRLLAAVGLPAEHDRSDLDPADPARHVQRHGQRLSRVVQRRDVGEKRLRVDVDGVPADRLDDRHAQLGEGLAEVAGRGHAVLQVVLVDDLLQPHGDGLQVASRQSPVGRKALRED